MKDVQAYNRAIEELKMNPIQGPEGTYHIKNGIIHYGYHIIGIEGFATSNHYCNIFH